MITPHEQERIRLLSDTELYPQAVEFMRSVGKQLPPTQINGLLNVSLANTYIRLKEFIDGQHKRTTWRRGDEHIPRFYKDLSVKLKQLENYARDILKARTEQPSLEDAQVLYMLIAREFIQHLLAENAYKGALRTFQNAEGDNRGYQNRPQGNNRGPQIRQGRA